jgi:hypothetical protein
MGGYFGSKATPGLCQPIIALIPPHDTDIETHLGAGAVMKRKPHALRNIWIDLDQGGAYEVPMRLPGGVGAQLRAPLLGRR